MDSCAVERQSLLITSTFTRLLDQISRAIASRLPIIRPEPRLSIPTTPLWTLKLMNQMSDVPTFETVATRNFLDSHSPCS
jgi:hypothetical protein